jgi:hypothetical protein
MRKQKLLFFTLIFFCVFSANADLYFSPSEDDLTDILQWRISFLDSVEFSNPEYDDKHWQDGKIVGLWKLDGNGEKGVRWYRSRIFISQDIPLTENLAIFVPIAISAYEVFWDGVKIGESGVVANDKNNEKTGKSAMTFIVRKRYTSVGEHILAFRISNFSAISGVVEENPKIGFVTNIIGNNSRTLALSFLLVGILLSAALFNVIFIAKSLNIKAHITYVVLSVCCCGHILFSIFPSVFSLNLKNYYSSAIIGDIFWLGVLSLLPIYLYLIFNDKRWKLKSGIFFAICVVFVALPRLAIYDVAPIDTLWFWDFANKIFAAVSAGLSIIIAIKASFQKKKHAKTLLAGLILFAIGVLSSLAFGNISAWATGFAYLSIFMTIVIGRFFLDEMREKSAVEVKNARLELELLKTHIQPHFLLNSLNSIVAWIEEEPKIAVKLVNELSEELRRLMAFAERKTVSLFEEISLCKAHIQVMNLRKEKKITFEVQGNIDKISIPPLILHTALENGITHGFIKKDTGTFYLKVEKTDKIITIFLENDGDNKISQNKKSTGTGNKYIIQRLSELYGKDFKFISQPKADGWQVIFEIPNNMTQREKE